MACRFHQTVATPLCSLYSHESQLGLVHWIDATQLLKKRKSGWLNLFGREVRELDGRFVSSMSSAYSRLDFHGMGFSLVLADVGIAMEKARKAHRPYLLAKVLRLFDIFTVAMTQQALLLDQTSECSCASATATSSFVCVHTDDEVSLTTFATCMMNYQRNAWRRSSSTLLAWARYQPCIANILLCRQLFSKERCVKCVWHRTRSTLLARDRCRLCPPRLQFRTSVGKIPQGKRMKTVENHTCFHIFFPIF